ncbi:MAG: hypothetical protein K5985_12125 [Lachnospiraceae bacterium]|nr:hypothetical protein [Lachnospiraceae bacterium]
MKEHKAISFIQNLKDSYREDKKTFIWYSVLRFLVFLTAIRCIFTKNWEYLAMCVLALFMFLLPSLVQKLFKIKIPALFQIIIFCFIFAAEILGEVDHFYVHIPGWDTMLHTMNGFLCAAVGFSLIDLLNRSSKKVQLSPFYLAFMAFCFSMTVGVLWEFFECFVDITLYNDMQKDFIVQAFGSVTLDPAQNGTSIHVKDITQTIINTASGQTYTIDGGYLDIGILDTMKDLFVNFIGAVVMSTIGYFYEMTHNEKSIAKGLMLEVAEEDTKEEKNGD